MAKTLMIHPDKCTGCRTCELACSFFHDGEFRPTTSRISIHTWEMEGFSTPMTCQQCEDAPCVAVCPSGAMHIDPTLNCVAWDAEKCIGCRMCTLACPFGAVFYQRPNRIVKCDLCGGKPECVAFCPTGALEYVEETDAVRGHKKAFAAEFKRAFEEVG